MEKPPYNIYDEPFLYRIHPQKTETPKEIFVLIHGWTGNENSMSVFIGSIPDSAIAILPRGVFRIDEGQYGWINVAERGENDFSSYQKIAVSLHNSITKIFSNLTNNMEYKVNLIGFSQGGALSLVYSLLYPHEVPKAAILSGFLPRHYPITSQTTGMQSEYYVAHGTKDPLVEYERAEEIRDYLISLGAEVHFCKADIGHRVSPSCVAGLKSFFEEGYRT